MIKRHSSTHTCRSARKIYFDLKHIIRIGVEILCEHFNELIHFMLKFSLKQF